MPYRLDIAGWMSEADLIAIEALAGSVPAGGKVVEVGTFLGRSTWAWCKSVPASVHVVAIDTYNWLPEFGTHQMQGDPYNQSLGAEALFDKNTADCNNLTKIVSPSLAVRDGIADADIIFIDALHKFPEVALDIGYYSAFVKPGGFLSGDDYSEDHDDVRQSVDAMAGATGKTVQQIGTKLWQIEF